MENKPLDPQTPEPEATDRATTEPATPSPATPTPKPAQMVPEEAGPVVPAPEEVLPDDTGPTPVEPETAVVETGAPEAVAPEVVGPVMAGPAATIELPPGADSIHDVGVPVLTEHGHEYPRFRLMARIEHMMLLVSFTILCLTGLPQKFPFSPLSQWMIEVMGGIEVARMIHRWAAIVLILGTIYHLLTSAYRLFVKHEDMRMLPDLKDGIDMRDTVAYNLGFIDEPPKMRKFNFGEKFEYWAVVWGTAVMIVTGFILWNPIAATQILPGNLIPVALEAHGWEAVLAAVSIIIWHLYNVLVKHRNLSMFTGTLSHKIMEEEHALELERLDEGGAPWKVVPPEILARRRRAYFAVASVVVVLALVLVVWMFTFEDTAIIVPAATRDVFVPLATPNP